MKNEEFYKNIKSLCKINNISVKKLCLDLKFNYNSFRINAPRNNLSADKIIKIAKYFNINLLELNEKINNSK